MQKSMLAAAIALAIFGQAAQAVPADQLSPEELASLSWLGPLPDEVDQRAIEAFFDGLNGELPENPEEAVEQFRCRLPAELGPVPMMDAVIRFAQDAEAAREDEVLRRGVFTAAAQGNWMARSLVFELVMRSTKTGPVERRAAQLMAYAQRNKVGSAYVFWATALAAGYGGSARFDHRKGLPVYAALHGSYAAQRGVGESLIATRQSNLMRIGENMVRCAETALPGSKSSTVDAVGPDMKKSRPSRDGRLFRYWW